MWCSTALYIYMLYSVYTLHIQRGRCSSCMVPASDTRGVIYYGFGFGIIIIIISFSLRVHPRRVLALQTHIVEYIIYYVCLCPYILGLYTYIHIYVCVRRRAVANLTNGPRLREWRARVKTVRSFFYYYYYYFSP